MIECLNKKEKVEGYVDGKQYLDKKKRLQGFLEQNSVKDKNGYILLILRENNVITLNEELEYEEMGYLKENKIYNKNNGLIFEFLKDKREILDRIGKIVLFLKGTANEIEKLNNIDFFGIATIFLELFS
ncbi:MAG: hypothetical protein ACFFD2_18180 [Promethearchaeota archaeon]